MHPYKVLLLSREVSISLSSAKHLLSCHDFLKNYLKSSCAALIVCSGGFYKNLKMGSAKKTNIVKWYSTRNSARKVVDIFLIFGFK